MDRLQSMRSFVAIVDAGSLSGAARQLHLGQPAVSKALAALEEHLGARLLTRTTRSHALTEAGRRFYDRARIALDEADAAFAAARAESASLNGWLRIAAPPVLASQLLIPLLPQFRQRHPALALDLVLDDRQIDLVEEGIDVALRAGDPGGASLVGRRLPQIERLIVGAADYLERAGAPDHPDRLGDHPLIAYSRYSAEGWTMTRDEETVRPDPQARVRVSSAEGLRACVLAGMGLALASSLMFRHELADGRVRRVLPGWQLAPADLWVLYPQGRRATARAREFADWLAGAVG